MSNVSLLRHYGTSAEYLANVARISTGSSVWDGANAVAIAEDADRLLSAIYKAGHLSVFEFADFTFSIEAPIFVARQLMRYRCASYIERSLRRCLPLNGDQDDTVYSSAVEMYKQLAADGQRRENARAVLPLSTPTRFLWKLNARELFHVFDERLGRGVQNETAEVVQLMLGETTAFAPTIATIWRGGREQ